MVLAALHALWGACYGLPRVTRQWAASQQAGNPLSPQLGSGQAAAALRMTAMMAQKTAKVPRVAMAADCRVDLVVGWLVAAVAAAGGGSGLACWWEVEEEETILFAGEPFLRWRMAIRLIA